MWETPLSFPRKFEAKYGFELTNCNILKELTEFSANLLKLCELYILDNLPLRHV